MELRTPPWIGQKIFGLNDPPINGGICAQILEDMTIDKWEGGPVNYTGYCQMQRHMIYTREQVRKWFQIMPPLLDQLEELRPDGDQLLAHLRIGDYAKCGYVVVSPVSYGSAMLEFNLAPAEMRVIQEELPTPWSGDPSWLPDFYRMMRAPVLLRANSTFSWWAATLGHGQVYSPVIVGLEGGKVQDCKFVKGNHPRFIDAANVEDLYLKES